MTKELCSYLEIIEGEEDRFTVHQEPSQAQKQIDDDFPPKPWPWWVSGTITGGPYATRAEAIQSVLTYCDEKWQRLSP